jgi:hypothetical protein
MLSFLKLLAFSSYDDMATDLLNAEIMLSVLHPWASSDYC